MFIGPIELRSVNDATHTSREGAAVCKSTPFISAFKTASEQGASVSVLKQSSSSL